MLGCSVRFRTLKDAALRWIITSAHVIEGRNLESRTGLSLPDMGMEIDKEEEMAVEEEVTETEEAAAMEGHRRRRIVLRIS